MDALLATMLFGLGRKGRKDGARDGKGPRRSDFMDGIYDEVHGAHLDGDSLVLSGSLGGGRYPVRDAGHWVAEGDAGFRLVFQPMDAKGRRTGPTKVTVNLISGMVVEDVCRSAQLSGMLSAYSTDRDAAVSLMSRSCEGDVIEYPFTADLFESSFPSVRARRWEAGVLPGPMCLHGDCLSREEFASPDGKPQMMDMQLGFHIARTGLMALSSDLGGAEFGISGDLDGVGQGEFRILIIPSLAGAEGDPVLTDTDIGWGAALRVCSDPIRNGTMCVYTPDRRDAEDLMRCALEGRRPVENTSGNGLGGFPCFEAPRGSDLKARAVYGRPRRG